MGLSSITPRTFNSTGAQSVCRANKPEPDEVIESEFLSKCQIEYINGTGLSTIHGSLKSLPNDTLPTSTFNQDTFYVESDVDAISGVDLSISVRFDDGVMDIANVNSTATPEIYSASDLGTSLLPKDFLLSIINKVEVVVGGHLHQTILPQEIFMRNLTEQCTTTLDDWLNSGVDNPFKNNYEGPYSTVINGFTAMHPDVNRLLQKKTNNQMQIVKGSDYTFTISLPVTGRTNDMHNSFLQSGAIKNNTKIIVYYNQLFPSTQVQFISSNGTPSPFRGIGSTAVIRDPTTQKNWLKTYRSWLTVKDHIFTETETEFLKNNIVNRVVTTSQSVVRQINKGETIPSIESATPFVGTSNLTMDSAIGSTEWDWNVNLTIPSWKEASDSATLISKVDISPVPVTIDLSSFDLNASHLLISAFASTHGSDGSISISPLDTSLELDGRGNNPVNYTDDQYNLTPNINRRYNTNGLNYGGLINNEPIFHAADLFAFTGYSHADTSLLSRGDASNMRGILSGWLDSVEVKLGSETTGRIPATALIKNSQDFGLTSAGGAPVYVVPLANKPFSTSGVPMNRVGRAQVVLYVDQRYGLYYGPFTQVDGNFNNTYSGTSQVTGTPSKATGQKIVPWSPITKVAVVGVGTKVQTTVGGSTSFA